MEKRRIAETHLQHSIQQRLGGRWASGHVKVDGDDTVAAPDDRVGVCASGDVEVSGERTEAWNDMTRAGFEGEEEGEEEGKEERRKKTRAEGGGRGEERRTVVVSSTVGA